MPPRPKASQSQQELGGPGTPPHPQADAINELLDQLGASAVAFRLYRVTAGDLGFICRVGLDITAEAIKDAYGGGTYVLQAVDSDNKIGPRRQFKIEGAPRPVDAPGPRVETRPNEPREAQSLPESVWLMRELLREARNPPAVAQQGNPVEMATNLVTAVLAAAKPIAELVKELRGPARKEAPAEKDELRLVKVYVQGMRAAQAVGGPPSSGGGGGGSWQDRFLDIIAPALTGAAAPAAGAPDSVSLLPLTPRPAAAAGNGAPVVENPNNPAWVQAFAPYVPHLQPLAAADSDPTLYADLAFDRAPDELLAHVDQQVSRGEDFAREFHAAFPATAGHRKWWSDFFGRLWFDVRGQPGANDVPDNGATPGG